VGALSDRSLHMKVLVTGAAGFIGMHTCLALLARGDEVVGVDNLNDYYDPQLKQARLARLAGHPAFRFERADIADPRIADLFSGCGAERVVHLAAQAGVRYSLRNPKAYVESNLVGFANVIEACLQNGVRHLVYASSSNVYGNNSKLPFSETDPVDHPVNLYAATKRSNELVAHSYSHLFGLPTTGLRFFTVYGPWGRPDMAYFSFAHSMALGRPIDVFNEGRMERDFTYIDDAVQAVVRVLDRVPQASSVAAAPYRLFNVGNHTPVSLLEFIRILERFLGKTVAKRLLPMQPGDMVTTYADTTALADWIGFSPATPLADGLEQFVAWFRGYHGL
jgi:UDP-glucuronate 4-epimerase